MNANVLRGHEEQQFWQMCCLGLIASGKFGTVTSQMCAVADEMVEEWRARQESRQPVERHDYKHLEHDGLPVRVTVEEDPHGMAGVGFDVTAGSTISVMRCLVPLPIAEVLFETMNQFADALAARLEKAAQDRGKPPRGLTPRSIWLGQRIEEIDAAMERYNAVKKPIPALWAVERVLLVKQQEE